MQGKIQQYIETWIDQGYSNGIPDEVPNELMHERLAPSYKAIALAVLQNDHGLQSLGFSHQESKWYSVLKQIEIQARPILVGQQERLL